MSLNTHSLNGLLWVVPKASVEPCKKLFSYQKLFQGEPFLEMSNPK